MADGGYNPSDAPIEGRVQSGEYVLSASVLRDARLEIDGCPYCSGEERDDDDA